MGNSLFGGATFNVPGSCPQNLGQYVPAYSSSLGLPYSVELAAPAPPRSEEEGPRLLSVLVHPTGLAAHATSQCRK
eukprot:scaffold257577_cov17-Tisochrysis_lutea.AAC.1